MKNSILCPSCNLEIDVQDVLAQKLEQEIKNKYVSENASKEKEFSQKEALLKQKAKELINQEQKQKEQLENQVQERLKQETLVVKKRLQKELENEQSEAINKIQLELNEKNKKLKDLKLKEVEIEQLKREKNNAIEEAKLSAQKEINAQLKVEKEKLAKLQEEKEKQLKEQLAINLKEELSLEHETKVKALEKQLRDQVKLTEKMKLKQEQGSMQLQGETLELIVEEYLKSSYPYDTIQEIKKGVNGADCLQIINTPELQNCGSILYETKNAQNFANDWITKLKKDLQEKGANIGVLISKVYPQGIQRMGFYDGIYICTYKEFKGLSSALRQGIIEVARIQKKNENKGDKIELLYDYLTSADFKMRMTAIMEAFNTMRAQIESEKKAFIKQWKLRESQLDVVFQSTMGMYGSIKGIAQNPKISIESLEENSFLSE